MNKKQHQTSLDVERLHKTAECFEININILKEAERKIEVATEALKIIATLAEVMRYDWIPLPEIRTKAIEALKLMDKL